MEKIKFNIDRKPLSEEAIKAKQDFDLVLKGSKVTPKVSWSKYGYYGVVGLAGIAMTIGFFKLFQSNTTANEGIATFNQQQLEQLGQEELFLSETFVQQTLNSANTPEYNVIETVDKEKLEIVKTLKAVVQPELEEVKEFTEPLLPLKNNTENIQPVEKPKVDKKSIVPEIAGVKQGSIPWTIFRSNEIFIDENQVVKQFSIQYTSKTGDRTVTVFGNRISPEVERELEAVGLNQKIFITNILSQSSSNDSRRLLSMELDVLF